MAAGVKSAAMKRTLPALLLLLLVLSGQALAWSKQGHQLVGELAPIRAKHRLAWADFARAARAKGALLLQQVIAMTVTK